MSNPEADPRKNLPAEARQLIAHARNDITIPFFTTVMQPLDEILIMRGGGKGLKLYDEIERDSQAFAVLQKRKLILIAREWQVTPASGSALDTRAAKLVEEQLQRLNFDQMTTDLLDATLKGFSISEVIWKRDGAVIVPERIVSHDQRRFAFDESWKPRLLTMAAPMEGEVLPERKFITHRFGVKGNNPYGLGLGSRLYWPVMFKREGIAFWLTFLDKFASPTPVGKYPLGMLPADQSRLLATLQDMVQSGAVVVPMGTDVTFLEATRSGSVSYQDWCAYWDKQMSLTVFGSTLATDIDGQGSRAAAETHKEVEEQIADGDGDLLSDTLRETLFQWLIDYNLPGAGVPSVRRLRAKNESAHEDLRKKKNENRKSEIDLLFDLADRMKQPEQFTKMAIALASADLLPSLPPEVLRQVASLGVKPDPTKPVAIDQITPPSFAEGHDHGLEDLVVQLGTAVDPLIRGWIGHLRDRLDATIANGGDLAEFSDALLDAYSGLSVDAAGQVIGDALSVAEATGNADVQDEMAARRKGRQR